jgi:DNA repair protein RecO (recombination protein O)
MPLHESEAIVLQSYSLGEADRLVSFLSRSMGRVRGVAAGARKTKSRFGSTLERLSYVRIWFFERETRDLVRISQCEIIESFLDAFSDYASSVALAILTEVTEAVLPDREPSDANFRLLLLTAQTVKRTRRPELPLAYFALWTVKLGGWLPALDRCAECGKMLNTKENMKETLYIHPRGSAVYCSTCRKPGLRALSSQAVILARRMFTERLDKLAEYGAPGIAADARVTNATESHSARAAREVTGFMLDIIEHQIDRKLASRKMLESPV